MTEPPGFSFRVAPGSGRFTARKHYEAGIRWLVHMEAAPEIEDPTRCATAAAAYFAAGQLALAIDEAQGSGDDA